MKVVRTEYEIENNKPTVYLFCRENGKREVIKDSSFRPYLYVLPKEKNRVKGLDCDTDTHVTIDGQKVVKIFTELPGDVPLIRDRYTQTWEADVLFSLRYQIDKIDVMEPCNPEIMFLDIETDNTGRVPDPNSAAEPIVCLSVHYKDIFTTFIFRNDFTPGKVSKVSWDKLHEIVYCQSEKEMLQAFLDFIKKEEPDVLSGWNLVFFDLTYIINRMKRLGLNYNDMSPMGKVFIDEKHGDVIIKGVSVIDLLAAYRRFAQWTQGLKESYKLDFIGKEVAGIGKMGEGTEVRWMWRYDTDKLIDYNANDCRICYEINKKQQLLDFLDELRRLCHCQLEDCMTMTKMADCYILTLFHNKKVFPTKTHHEKHSYQGAIVDSWASGIQQNVAVFDVKSLYPSIIVSAGLSPETMRDKTEEGAVQLGKYYVQQNIQGYLPEVIGHLFSERAKYKKLRSTVPYGSDEYKFYNLRQEAVKRLLNSLYGQTAYPNSRIYDARVAETITWMGRQIITWSKSFLESIGHKVIYIDTDGLHAPFEELDIPYITGVLGLLNDSYNDFARQHNLKGHIFEMEFQKVYRKVFYGVGTKKRYAGAVCYREGKETNNLDVWGFEIKRSDASQFTRKLQERVFDMLLREDKSKEEILRYIGDEIDRLRKGNYTFSEIGIPKGLSKDPKEYITGEIDKTIPLWQQKGIPANIRGALYSMEVLGHDISSKPKMIYVLKMPDPLPQVDVICFDEERQVPPGIQIDVDAMLDKMVKAKLESIFEGINWRMSDLVPWWRGKPRPEGEATTMFDLDSYTVTKK